MKFTLIAAVAVLTASTAVAPNTKSTKNAKDTKKAEAPAMPSDNYDVLMQQYLESARLSQPTAAVADTSWMTGLFGDLRARRVNDLVTINVIETLSAVGSADSS